MPTYSVQVPTFLGGISQQSAAIRQSNLVEEASNVEFMATEGTIKRYPTKWITSTGADLSGYKIAPMERDDADYIACFGDADVRVYDTDGNSIPIYDKDDNLADAADYAYLSGATYDDIRYHILADTIFTLNRQQVVAETAGRTLISNITTGEAGLFVKQNNYGVEFTVEVKTSSMGAAVKAGFRTPNASFSQAPASTSFTATAGQAAGTNVFFLSFFCNSLDDINIRVNGTIVNDKYNEFELDPGIVGGSGSDLRHTGTVVNTGDTVAVEITKDTAISFFLDPAYVRRRLQAELADVLPVAIGVTSGEISDSALRLSTNDDIEIFEVTDSQANTFISGWTDRADQISDLPTHYQHGAVVRITGRNTSGEDDYYVRFATDKWVNNAAYPDNFDSPAWGWGQGSWNETTKPGLSTGNFDNTTMPHRLQREVDDASGTVTGTPNQIFFRWAPVEWDGREAGDEETNKSPAFAGEKINDLFIIQNRLGFLSQAEVSLSQAASIENFWRTTVLSLPGDERMSFTASDLDGDTLRHAIPYDKQLLIFSELGQAVVSGNPTITPQTVQAPMLSSYRTFRNVKPVSTGRSLFFGQSAGKFASIREFAPGSNTERLLDQEATLSVPRLVPSDLVRMTAGSSANMLACLSGDRATIYLYQYLRSGSEQVQAAWTTWTLAGTVDDIAFMDERLIVLTTRDSVTHLVKMELGPGRAETGQDFVIRADDQTQATFQSYDAATDRTTFQAPAGWTFDADEDLIAVIAGNPGDEYAWGSPLVVVDRTVGTRSFKVDGDLEGYTVLIGRPYEASITMSKPLAKNRNGAAILGGFQMCRRLRVFLDDTGYVKSSVSYVDADASEEEFLDDLTDVGDFFPGPLRSGEMEIGIHADIDDFKVTLSSSSTLPFNIVTGTWDTRLETKHPII